MIEWAARIQAHFDRGFYTTEQVMRFVTLGKITGEEANQIVAKEDADGTTF
ncbi:XkdX family protein [Listeria booriae]|uniref:XkdX family protein n=1 Tax=Listeria booriae TaxID=1552123 RepID=UPI0016245214|nr:XkdX family protein [Listeria booriae]MBC1235187.1 XkdX family protein [Listeria booriae]